MPISRRRFPKTLITTGTRDLFLTDCARLSTKMRAAGIDCELRVWEGMWHVFEFETDLPEADRSLAEIARLRHRPGPNIRRSVPSFSQK